METRLTDVRFSHNGLADNGLPVGAVQQLEKERGFFDVVDSLFEALHPVLVVSFDHLAGGERLHGGGSVELAVGIG